MVQAVRVDQVDRVAQMVGRVAPGVRVEPGELVEQDQVDQVVRVARQDQVALTVEPGERAVQAVQVGLGVLVVQVGPGQPQSIGLVLPLKTQARQRIFVWDLRRRQ